ncbi:hypothetical protein [Komagataeibacter kakiaceti]|uniref:hypothetical protein n=1 Tax=Komagataeibacter kakiaceti TaxID=943261 RepID=UPI001F57DD56|nr:hypothetical protein [Komagataeibacter kakiaceti]
MATFFKETLQFDTLLLGERFHFLPRAHATQAIDAQYGDIFTAFGDEMVPVRTFHIAE